MLTGEFKEGCLKSIIVPQNIDATYRHVTRREIKASLGTSTTSIHKARVDWRKKIIKKYDHGAPKAVYNVYRGDESKVYAYDPETKQQSKAGVFQDKPNPTKVIHAKSTG
ncbi:hypothetical protein EVAR_40393_1 [Eumeta japonica]|uniref:Mariner Mos1 transposase n=1 Tax=Eumeta variegata TaxID=151549 RepID=A0A4C1WBX4_EUMVA|nr:hypothetical protein EVAR_40393_1 [Eumeta japonica]